MADDRDDWEPEPDEDGEGRGAGEGNEGGEPGGGKPESEPLTDDERATLKMLRDTGLSPRELVARARRDFQRERTGGAGAGGGQATGKGGKSTTAGGAAAGDDDAKVVTREELKQVMVEATRTAQVIAASERNRVQLESSIDDLVTGTEGYEQAAEWRLEAIRNEVAVRLARNVRLAEMGPREYRAEIEKVTKQVLKEDSGKEPKRREDAGKELESRARAARESGGAGGGSVTRAAGGQGGGSDEASTNGQAGASMDAPRYGPRGPNWYTLDDVEEEHEREKERFFKAQRAGRAG